MPHIIISRYQLTAQPQVWAQPLAHSQATGCPHVQAGLVRRTRYVGLDRRTDAQMDSRTDVRSVGRRDRRTDG